MHNFDFLKKTELSYILNNVEAFGPEFIAHVEDYCQRVGLQIDKIKAKKPEWIVHYHWLNVNVDDERMLISKTEDAKASEVNKYSCLVVALVILIVFAFIEIVKTQNHDIDFYCFILIGLPLSIALLIAALIGKRRMAEKLNQDRKIIVYGSSKVEFVIGDDKIIEKDIKAINLFCQESQEAGSPPYATLELKLMDREVLRIDSGNNYLELLKCGNDIAKLTKKKLNVFSGYSPNKDKVEL